MAFLFETTPVATIKARSSTSTEDFTIKGINASLTSATTTAIELNKVMTIFGKEIAGDEHMSLTIVKQGKDEDA